MHQSEARFRRLSALSADVYWEQDEELRFTLVSSSTSSKMEPGRADALVGKTRWETDYVNMAAADWAAHRAVLEARQPFRDLELCRYDASGQLVTGSFMDYCLPRATDVPSYQVDTRETPCTHNPLGVKGCGEAGAIGAPAALINAITDALGVKDIPMPATPQTVWRTLQQKKAA